MKPKILDKNIKVFKKSTPIKSTPRYNILILNGYNCLDINLSVGDFENSNTLKVVLWSLMYDNFRYKLFLKTELKKWVEKLTKFNVLRVKGVKTIVTYFDELGRGFAINSDPLLFTSFEEAVETINYYISNDDFNWNYKEVEVE